MVWLEIIDFLLDLPPQLKNIMEEVVEVEAEYKELNRNLFVSIHVVFGCT